MEDMSFLLCRVSLVVLLPLLPLGGWRDALSAPVGSLSIPGMLKLLMKNKFASAQRTVMEDFGFFVSLCCCCCSLQRKKRLLPHWGGPKGTPGSAVAAAKLEFLESGCVSNTCRPIRAQSSGTARCGCSTGRHSSLGGTNSSPAPPRCRFPRALGRGCFMSHGRMLVVLRSLPPIMEATRGAPSPGAVPGPSRL